MKYYHMIIQRLADLSGETRREYVSTVQGSAPNGWICVGVCGYHEKPRQVQYPCKNCVYFCVCGENTRTAPCDGRMTRREAARRGTT